MTKHSAFNWADALSLASDLTEEERFVQKTAADFADKRLLPGIVEANRSGHFDREIMREMGALGLLGPTLPEEYGGAAVSHVAYGLVSHEVEAVDSGYRSALSVQSSLVIHPIVNALGTVTDREGNVVACHKGSNWPENLKATDLMRAAPDSVQPGWNGDEESPGAERKNTTISVVVTNRSMTPAELQRLAVQVHTSMARGIQPFASEFDGDVLYAVSTNEVETGPGETIPSMEIGVAASELMWDAILAAVPAHQVTQPDPDPELVLPARTLEKYAGTYRFSHLAELTVSVENGALVASATGERDVFQVKKGTPRPLLAATRDTFTVERGRYPFSIQFAGDEIIINPGRWQQTGYRVSAD